MNGEIKRRSELAGIFRNDEAIIGLRLDRFSSVECVNDLCNAG